MDEKEIFEICNQVDSLNAEYLTEHIKTGTSYDRLEAHHGILPISRTQFYIKCRMAREIMEKRKERLEEERD